ncbi:hypothetical protein FGG08_005119 [Glutinoglossum americanum]|uniref:Nucleoporin NUP82 n=1 Tax=Glutinoglossum americanum TaxID=1670608 RepID=A0A9P8I7V6_9PEZI|nr:hypothetical protein FGG08_005119 [Glutinoglossum americanum]
MPKILSYTPSWLSRPTPGFNLFSPISGPDITDAITHSSYRGRHGPSRTQYQQFPRRRLARRGTEVFVAVGNQLRWADLLRLKKDWAEREARQHRRRRNGGLDGSTGEGSIKTEDRGCYRVLKTPGAGEIEQLIISPNGVFLAILTSHMVYIAVLPDSSRLSEPDDGPMRIKTYTLGPTIHVLTQSQVVSALWHPLGIAGLCLVTVTADSIVRIWELNVDNRWSFDSPTLTIDLIDLVNGTYSEEDSGASIAGKNRGFSLDTVEMEVASACFGGTAAEEENGWASMTLWVAMKEGDVYALCPVLPNRWQAPPTLIPSLSVSIVAKAAAVQDDEDTLEEDRRNYMRQFNWISAIDSQNPALLSSGSDLIPDVEVYTRPAVVRSVPELQGPFDLDPAPFEADDDLGLQLTDIYAVAGHIDEEELCFGDDESIFGGVGRDGLSVGIVCLSTSNGRVHVCLDSQGVEGRWASKTPEPRPKHKQLPVLLKLESIDTLSAEELRTYGPVWPVFSQDPYSRYSFFVNHGTGITFMSLSTWSDKLERELQNSEEAGSEFRMSLLMESAGTLRERIVDTVAGSGSNMYRPKPTPSTINANTTTSNMDYRSNYLTGSTVFDDPDLGYFLLAAAPDRPFGTTLDLPGLSTKTLTKQSCETDFKPTAIIKPREPYCPASAFFTKSSLPSWYATVTRGANKRFLDEEIRLSSATLDVMVKAHQILSNETQQLGVAVAELFRRCEILQSEFRGQINCVREIADRVDAVTGEDGNESKEAHPTGQDARIRQRMKSAYNRQEDLIQRYDILLKKATSTCGRKLSDKEKAWVLETQHLQHSLSEDGKSEEYDGPQKSQLWRRYVEAKRLAADLLAQAQETTNDNIDLTKDTGIKVPSEIRKAKIAQVNNLLERECALVDAVKARLERLSVSSPARR